MTLLAAVERPHTSPAAPDCAPLPWPALYSGPAGPALCRRLSPGRLLTAPPRLLLSALSLPASLYRRLGKFAHQQARAIMRNQYKRTCLLLLLVL